MLGVPDIQPCNVVFPIWGHMVLILHILISCIWWTEPDGGQSRELHGGPGERVDQEAAVVPREDEPAAKGGALVADAAEAREAEGLAVGEAVEGAVREREQRQRRGQVELPRGGAPLRAHGGEAGAVRAGREEAEHHAGQVPREVGPRRRMPGARRRVRHRTPAEPNLARGRERRTRRTARER